MRKDSFHLFDDESKKYSSTVRSSLRPKRSHAMAIKHNSETSSQRANLSPTKSSRKSHSNYSNGKPIEKLSQQLDKRTMTLIKQVDQFILRHTWIVPLAILCAVGSLFALNPTPSNPVYNFIFIEYRIDPETPGQSVQYGKGPRDCLFVVFYAIFMFFARDFVMLEFLQPLAQWFGLSSQAKQVRFMEQGYKSIYLAVSSSTGLYIMSKSPMWYFNMKAMCAGFPQLTLNGPFKLYFLWQWAYWVSEIVVMGLGREKPRKDYNQLVIHHWVAFSLIGISYCFHYTYMGLAAFLVHDVSDLFLATSKMLSYVDSPLVTPYFALFVASWIYCRHYLYIRIIYAAFTEFDSINSLVGVGFLSALQCLNIFWLGCILRVTYRLVYYNDCRDDRSEDEDEGLDNKCLSTG